MTPIMDTMFVVFQHTVKPGSYLWNSTLMTDVYSSSFPDMDAIEFSSHSFDNVGIDGIHILFEHLYKSHYPLEVEELECDEDLENEVVMAEEMAFFLAQLDFDMTNSSSDDDIYIP